jgi:non-specific protein-tyrosine kinase
LLGHDEEDIFMPTPDLMTLTDPRSAAAEAYRTLRTNLMFSSVENPVKTLLLTAASSQDGKSVALANLAVTFAQSGHKTILVDADLRQPQQHTLWGVSGDKGLTTMMLDDKALAEPPLASTNVDKLAILPAGPLPPNPVDLLSSRRMDDIIALLKERADYVLFDCAPVLQASDAVVLGRKIDGALLVVRAGASRRDHTAQAREALERVHVRVLGAVLTNSRE